MTAARPPADSRILREARPAQVLLYGAVAAGFAAAACLVGQIVLLSVVVDRVFLAGQPLPGVAPLLLVMLGLLFMRSALIWAQALLGQRSSSLVKGRLRARLTAQIFGLGPAYTAGERSGELTNTAVEGVETLDAYITGFVPARLLAGLVPALVFAVVLVMDPLTTIVYVVAGPVLVLLLALIGSRTRVITEQRFHELSLLSAHFLDMLQGLPTLKLFGRSRAQAANIEEISRQYGNTTMDVLRTAFQTSLVQEWAATAATAMVALEVSLRLINHMLPFTTALAVLLLTPEFFVPLRQMALKYHAGTAGKAAAERIYAILDLPTRGAPAGAGHPKAAELRPGLDLNFSEVTYAYDAGSRPALRGLSFTIPEGQTVALVGATGAGKSTAAALLLRTIEPDGGSLTAGGVPLGAIDPRAWRERVAWVPQRPYLFNGTVAENVRLARPGACDEDVVAACRAAHAHDFITLLPGGYDTALGERGARLSGGQQQRLAIARAILKDAPLIILDEATAHLDPATEGLVKDALAQLLRGRTALIIVHRLELAYMAGQIVVMEAGRAVETGTHAELLARNGAYRRLVEGYEVGQFRPASGGGVR